MRPSASFCERNAALKPKQLPTPGLGYLIQCDPYQRACGTCDKELGVGALVILDLVSELPSDVSFKIYGDRYFLLSNLLKF